MQFSFSITSTKNAHLPCLANVAMTDLNNVHVTDFLRLLPSFLTSAANYYPDFCQWLGKVENGIANGDRSMVMAWSEKHLAGLSILKHTEAENKICTFWIFRKFRHQGLASALLGLSLPFFRHDPLITIPDFKLEDFANLIIQKGFKQQAILPGLYSPHTSEYFFTIDRHAHGSNAATNALSVLDSGSGSFAGQKLAEYPKLVA